MSTHGNGRPDPVRHARVWLEDGTDLCVDAHCVPAIIDAMVKGYRYIATVGMGGQQQVIAVQSITFVESWSAETVDRYWKWKRLYAAAHRELAPECYRTDDNEETWTP